MIIDEEFEPVNNVGKPSKYITGDPEKICKQAHEMALCGMSDMQIARCLLIDKSTFSRWQQWFPELKDAVDSARVEKIGKVVDALYQRAVGYSHPEIKVLSTKHGIECIPVTKHYPPDVAAIQTILFNRMPHLWKSTNKLEVITGEGEKEAAETDYSQLSADEFAQLEGLLQKALTREPESE